MKIKLTGEYLSLNKLESEDLPNFTVITGKNGSGKTQLIEAIKNRERESRNAGVILTPKPTKRIQFEGIETSSFHTINESSWANSIKPLKDAWFRESKSLRLFLSSAFESDLNLDEIHIKNNFEIVFKHYLKLNKENSWSDNEVRFELSSSNKLFEYLIIGNRIIQHSKIFNLVSSISRYLEKKIEYLVDSDFFLVPIDPVYIDNNKLFQSDFTSICYVFTMNRYINEMRYTRKTNMSWNEKNNSIPPQIFNEKNTAPWDLFNQILEKTALDFEVIGVDKASFTPEIPFNLELRKKSSNTLVHINSLSSGEQIIFGLVVKLFTSSYYKNNIEYPDLVILDEPDSHLHPEMTQTLIDVLNETFVRELGIKVIITTHSPSTVALSPDESIFELNNIGECSLKKISKDTALELLTGPIPNLSIDYKNHKQVFVESPSDKYYYQSIFNTLKRENNELKSPLYFISNSMGKGNSGQVIDTISQIRQSGNNTCFGIIDWDQHRSSKEFVFVHGEHRRHTIENYLFDPIYIAILFLINKGDHNSYTITGFTPEMNPYKIIELEEPLLQEISDKILEPIENKFRVLKKDKELVEILYFNNKKIELPTWFLYMKHNELVEKITQSYKGLKKYQTQGEGELQKELTNIICQCYPMIPKDTVDVLSKISNGN